MSINRDAAGPGNVGSVPGEGRLRPRAGCRLEKQTKRSLLPPTQLVGIPAHIIQCPPDPPGVIHPDLNRRWQGGFTSTRDLTTLSA